MQMSSNSRKVETRLCGLLMMAFLFISSASLLLRQFYETTLHPSSRIFLLNASQCLVESSSIFSNTSPTLACSCSTSSA
jgi:hypothetical protein